MPTPIPNDNTHLRNLSNPTGLKTASGESSSGVDAATLNAITTNLVINGMINLSALQMIAHNTLSNLNSNSVNSLDSGKGENERSEKISELAFGVSSSSFKSSRINSLGDIMFELMVLMIQSTTERRQVEREFRATLAVVQMEQSKEIAQEIMEKMELEVKQIKMEALMKVAMSVGGNVASAFGSSAIGIMRISGMKKSAKLEEEIMRKQTTLKLTKSVANSVEGSLKSIDSVRDHFMSLLTQIIQATHDEKMRIIRNSAI